MLHEAILWNRQYGQSLDIQFLMAYLNAARESKFLIPFGTSSHIFWGYTNTSDSVPYLAVLTRIERKVLLFRLLYIKFWFSGKTYFMRIDKRSFKTLYNSVARNCKLQWCTETGFPLSRGSLSDNILSLYTILRHLSFFHLAG